jgi:HNH endonuclease
MCRSVAKDSNGNWKGGRTIHKAGYVMVRVPDHPRANRSPYVFEHILVAERILGRYLEPGESVHHRNGVRDDNRPENLELWIKPQPSGIRVSDAIAWAVEILERYVGEESWRTSNNAHDVSTLGGGGSRTRVFRDFVGASPSAAGELVLGSPPLTDGLRRPQPECSVPPGPRACPGGEPL